MRQLPRTYTTYSIGCAMVWAIFLVIAAAKAKTETMHNILAVFGGWVIGWTSATIARHVYPPPKKMRRT